MISASRSGRRSDPAKRFLISSFHSGMFHSRNAANRSDERFPLLALLRQNPIPLSGETVVAPAPLIGFFNPPPLNPASLFEPVQQRVERGDVEMEFATGADLDEPANIVAVARLRLQKRKDQQLGAALFPLFNGWHMCDSHMCYAQPR